MEYDIELACFKHSIFKSNVKKLNNNLKQVLKDVIKKIKNNEDLSSYDLHKLKNNLSKLFAVHLDGKSICLVFVFDKNNELHLVSIGNHDAYDNIDQDNLGIAYKDNIENGYLNEKPIENIDTNSQENTNDIEILSQENTNQQINTFQEEMDNQDKVNNNIIIKLKESIFNSSERSNRFKISSDMEHYQELLNSTDEDKKLNIKEDYQIVYMTPVEYIQRCAEMFGVTYDWLLRDRCDEKVPIYMEDMRKGTKFDCPHINLKTGQQEGLHRTIAAMKLDGKYKRIPVVVVRPYYDRCTCDRDNIYQLENIL